MIRTPLACALVAAVCAPAVPFGDRVEAQDHAAMIPLAADGAIEHRIAPGAEDRYHLPLAAGAHADILVEQKGIDLVVEVRDQHDNAIDEFQDEIRPNGDEHVEIVAEAPGTYSVRIRAAEGVVVAGAYGVRLAGRRAATDADREMQESRAARTSADALERTGRFAAARPLYERALSLAESARGTDGLYAASVLFALAGNALERYDDEGARALYRRAMTAFESRVGADHPYVAMARSRIAVLDERAGQVQKAEAAAREALAELQRSLGPQHPWVARCLGTLADLRADAGDGERAEELDRQALAILDRIHLAGTMLEAGLVNNLGEIFRQQGKYAAAEPLFRRSLAIGEARYGPDSYFVSTALQNLGIVARERKDYASAVAYYTRALGIRELLVGPDHPGIAGLLNNLANVYRATGDTTKALDMHFRALRLWERALGPYAWDTLLSVGNIAKTYAAAGDISNALAFQRRADAIVEMQLSLNLAVGSERQKLAFAHSVAERTDRTISLHLEQAPDNPDAASLAALVLLQRKGRVLDAMTDAFAAVRQRVADPGDRALMDRLNETKAQLARLAFGAPRQPGGQESFAVLEARKGQLEATLSEHSAEFRTAARPVTLEDVQAAIPDDAALVEFAEFQPFDPSAERNAEAYGPPRYAAYIVRKYGAPIGIDLGHATGIDRLVDGFRDAVRDRTRTDVKARARELDERIMQPVRPWLGTASRLLISPDGELNLVPFEALVDGNGRYLMEMYATSYLTSGRDLLRLQAPRAAPGRPVIVADPFFGEPAPARPRGAAHGVSRASVTTATQLSRLYFAPLAGTAAEARSIKTLFPDAALLVGPNATKSAVERVHAPRILHIASHGFFLDDEDDDGSPGATTDNPLLRSGVALAGANLVHGAEADGILTAFEAAGLDLWGTKLVTLSACDTGVGEVRSGEGVYGLRRAFVLAGAETLVMSLWPVSDYLARDTMVGYYTRLRAGLGRGDALREAKLSILRDPNRRHPYYWAAFIQSGEWADLDGRR